MSIEKFTKAHTHKDAHDTEVEAAESQWPRLTDTCLSVYKFLLDSSGHTDEEGTELTGIHSYRRRRADLKNAGMVLDSGRRRKTERGKNSIVWVAWDSEAELEGGTP